MKKDDKKEEDPKMIDKIKSNLDEKRKKQQKSF
jgi:hypothetical protein